MRNKRRRTRRMTISFSATVIVLSLAVLLGLTLLPPSNGVITKHISGPIPNYSGVLGQFAPLNVVQVSYNNFTAIRSINASALATGNYLEFARPRINLSAPSIEQRVSVVLSSPNVTIDVTIMDPDAFQIAYSAFQGSSKPANEIGGYPVFDATTMHNGTVTETWLTVLPHSNAFIVCSCGSIALEGMNQIVSVYNGSQRSLLTEPGVQRMLYVANGTSGHLGVNIQNYAGAVNSGKMTLITVDKQGSSIWLDYFVRFANSTQAESQISYFQTVYLGANRFESYDEILVATEFQPLSSMTRAVGIVG